MVTVLGTLITVILEGKIRTVTKIFLVTKYLKLTKNFYSQEYTCVRSKFITHDKMVFEPRGNGKAGTLLKGTVGVCSEGKLVSEVAGGKTASWKAKTQKDPPRKTEDKHLLIGFRESRILIHTGS